MVFVMDAAATALDARQSKVVGPAAHARTLARDGTAGTAQAIALATTLTTAAASVRDDAARQQFVKKVAQLIGGGGGAQRQPADGRRDVDATSLVDALTTIRGNASGRHDSAGSGADSVGAEPGAMDDDGGGDTVAARAPPFDKPAAAASGDDPPTDDDDVLLVGTTAAAGHTLLPLRESAADVLLQEKAPEPSRDDVVAGARRLPPALLRTPQHLLTIKARASFLSELAAVVAGGQARKRKRGPPLPTTASDATLRPLVLARLAAAAKAANDDASHGDDLVARLMLHRTPAGAAGLGPTEVDDASLVVVRALADSAAPYRASDGLRALADGPTARVGFDLAALASRAASAAAAVDVAAGLAATAVAPLGSDAALDVVATSDTASGGDAAALARDTLAVLEGVRADAVRSCACGASASLWKGTLAIERRLWDAACAVISRDDAGGARRLELIATAAAVLQAAAARVRQAADEARDATALPEDGAAASLAGYPSAVVDALENSKLRKQLVTCKPSWLEGDGNLERWAAPLLAAVADGLASFMPLPHAPDGGSPVAGMLPHIERQRNNACWMHAFHAVLGAPLGGVNAAGLYHLLAHVVAAGDDDKLAWRIASRTMQWEGIINSWHAHNPIYYGLFDSQLANVSLLLNRRAAAGASVASLLSVLFMGYVRLDSGSSTSDTGGSSAGKRTAAAGKGAGRAAPAVVEGPVASPFGRLLDVVAASLAAGHVPAVPAEPVAESAASEPGVGAVTAAHVRAAVKQLIIFHGQRMGGGGGIGHFVSVQLAPDDAVAGAGGADGSSRRWLLTDSAASPRVQLLRERDFPPTHRIFTASQRGVLAYALPVAPTARASARGVLWSNIGAVLEAVGLRSLGPAVIPAQVATTGGAAAIAAAQG